MRLPSIRGLFAKQAAEPQKAASPVTASTRSYADPWGFSPEIKAVVSHETIDLVVQAIPFLDVALRKLSRMVSGFQVTCENDATAEALNEWLRHAPVNYLFKGFNSFSHPHVRQAMQYGYSAGEIALTESRKDIGGLFVVPSKRVALIRGDNEVLLGERDAFGRVQPYEQQDLFVYSAWGKEADGLTGTSLLRSVPWIADIILRMELATRQKWQRHGAPSFLVVYKAKADVSIPPETLSGIREAIQTEWESSMKARWRGEGIVDFHAAAQGDFTVDPIDSNGELDFETPYRALIEQIVATTELAPFMLGLQWSTTERLSQQQADAIIGCIDTMRDELAPDFLYILGWVQRLRNLRGEIGIAWDDVNLQDATEHARAEVLEAQAQKLRNENAEWAWRNGMKDQMGAAELAGYDIEAPVVPLDAPAAKPGAGGFGFGGGNGVFAAQRNLAWQGYP